MTARLKIGHLIATNFFGGPEKQLIEHAQRIDRDRFSVILLSFIEHGRLNELLERASRLSIPARGFATGNPFNPRIVFDLARFLEGEGIRILCTHGYKSDVLGRISSRMAGIPEVIVSRGWTGEDMKVRLYESLDRFFLRFADHIVSVSRGQGDKVLGLGVAQGRTSVIHNGVTPPPVKRPCASLKAELGIRGDFPLAVSAGRLSPEKNFEGLIDAARLVRERGHDIAFAVFGEGPLRKKLEKKIRDADLGRGFFLPGFRKDFPALLDGADIFVLNSFTEGFPNVILEAYAAKKPVIATCVGGVPEIVINGTTGFLVRPGETGKMADYLVLLARDRDLRTEMGREGHEQVKAHFTFEIQTRKYEELYAGVYDAFYHHSRAC